MQCSAGRLDVVVGDVVGGVVGAVVGGDVLAVTGGVVGGLAALELSPLPTRAPMAMKPTMTARTTPATISTTPVLRRGCFGGGVAGER